MQNKTHTNVLDEIQGMLNLAELAQRNATEEEFEGKLPRQVVSMMVRSDAEYNSVCLPILSKK